MFTVYALYSPKHNKIYIGYTSDLKARMRSHNKRANKGWTTRYRPWEVVYTEEYESKAEAIKREKQLKSSRGRAFIWNIIHNKENK